MKIFSEEREAPRSQGADQVDAAEGKHLSSRVEQVCIDNKLSRDALTIKRTADLVRRAHKGERRLCVAARTGKFNKKSGGNKRVGEE